MQHNQKWALVTGASAGIGKEFCRILAERKWNLVLVARREQLLSDLKAELEQKYGIKIEIQKADLLDTNDLKKVVGLLEQYGVTYLVNNAGMLSRGNFNQKSLEEADRVIDLNVVSLVHLSHGAINHFKKMNTDCYLLNVGSLNSYISTAGQAVYCASKAFVKSFTLALSVELKNTKIKISCLCPGGTESEIMQVAGAEVTSNGQKFMMTAESVARLGIDGVDQGKLIVVPGFVNKISAMLSRVLPEKSMTSISSKVLESAVKLK